MSTRNPPLWQQWQVTLEQCVPASDQQRLFVERLRRVADHIDRIPPAVFEAFWATAEKSTGGLVGEPTEIENHTVKNIGWKAVWSVAPRED